MTVALVDNTLRLWKRARPFRFAVIGAAVSTVLAFLAPGAPQTAGVTPSQTTGTPSGPGGSTAGIAATPNPGPSQQCGPQGGTVIQAPIIVSASGQQPGNVSMGAAPTPAGGVPSEAQARFRRFITMVDAAEREGRLGELCARMAGALDLLQGSDYSFSDCFQDGEAKLVRAQGCANDMAASEARFTRLVAAHDSAKADASAARLIDLAMARQRMTDFDRSREKWGQLDQTVIAADQAAQEITASDQRIQALDAAARLPGADPAAQARLAAAGAALTSLDRTRLGAETRAALARSETAQAAIRDSDRRIEALDAAMRLVDATGAEGHDALITALSAVTPLDRSRLTPEQTQLFDRAQTTAGSFAVGDLVRAAQQISINTATPEELTRLAGLLSAARSYGPAPAPGSAEASAFDLAEAAVVRLEESDRRLQAMREKVAQIQTVGAGALGSDIAGIVDGLTAFDRSRMSDADLVMLAGLEQARAVSAAQDEQKFTRDVPVFVTASGDPDDLTRLLLDDTRKALAGDGFQIADAVEQAVITIELTRSDVQRKTVQLSGSVIDTAEVVVDTNARWIVSGKRLAVRQVRGDAAGSSGGQMSDRAVAEAAQNVAEAVAALAQPD